MTIAELMLFLNVFKFLSFQIILAKNNNGYSGDTDPLFR